MSSTAKAHTRYGGLFPRRLSSPELREHGIVGRSCLVSKQADLGEATLAPGAKRPIRI